MADHTNALSIAEQIYAAFNDPSPDRVMRHFADAAVYEDPLGGVHVGKAAVRAALAPGMTGQQTYTIERLFGGGADVVATWRLQIGAGPSRVSLSGMDILTFQGDLVVRKQCYMKASDLLIEADPG